MHLVISIQSNLNAFTSGNAENHQKEVGSESMWWEHGSFLEHDVEHHRLVGLSTEILEPSVKLSISCHPLLKKLHTVKHAYNEVPGTGDFICYRPRRNL